MVSGPHHRFGQTDENTRKHVLKLAKERDTCQPLTTREDTRLATTPDHAGIRATTRNSTRTLTRGTESISNDKIGRLPESFNQIENVNRDRDLIQGKAHDTTNSSLTSITLEENKRNPDKAGYTPSRRPPCTRESQPPSPEKKAKTLETKAG
ncbi:unnamed protein product [Brassica napus]|uniref:(rape) hypothetical protein n=1 Tax=Brassica napus TaxID=3708 RepID=A0A816IFD6_BRANA|nr:unnamed protein product [Brassica napus]